MKARTFFIFTMLIIILIAAQCNAQSFFAYKTPVNTEKKHKHTLAKKLLNKVKYAKKRHNNEGFALSQRRKYIRKNGI